MLGNKCHRPLAKIAVIFFQGSVLSMHDKGVIHDGYQYCKKSKIPTVGYHGVGGKSQYFFIYDVLNKILGGMLGDYLCEPTTTSNINKAEKYVRHIRQTHGQETIFLLVGYSRGCTAINRLCWRFPTSRFAFIMVDPVDPQVTKQDSQLPDNVIIGIVLAANKVMALPIIYYIFARTFFYSRYIERAKTLSLPLGHDGIGGRNGRMAFSFNKQGKVCDFGSQENISVRGWLMRAFFLCFLDAVCSRLQGSINHKIEEKLIKIMPFLQKTCKDGRRDNYFVDGKPVVLKAEQMSAKSVRKILERVSYNVSKSHQKIAWSFFSSHDKKQTTSCYHASNAMESVPSHFILSAL